MESIQHKLSKISVNAIRDLAVQLETEDVYAARELMVIASRSRPDASFIQDKLRLYDGLIREEKNYLSSLVELHNKRALAIVPIGFRCYTSMFLKKRIGISQFTLLFDVGFFPPRSIASILKQPQVSLGVEDRGSFDILQKFEGELHPTYGKGIKFKRSSKEEIDSEVSINDTSEINQFLDKTFGYYTIDNLISNKAPQTGAGALAAVCCRCRQ